VVSVRRGSEGSDGNGDMRIVILGTGAVGAYYGGQLACAGHHVICWARGENLAALRQRGIEIRTPEGTARASVAATDDMAALEPADFAVLAVKSYSLVDIAPAVRHCASQGATIVPLLNGVETNQRLLHLGVAPSAPLGGLTKISAVRVAPGVVERKGPLQVVVVGELDGRVTPRVEAIVEAFREAGADARVSDRIGVELWEKFVFLAALAAGCGLARCPVGPLRNDGLGRRLLTRAVAEVVAVARARGVALPDDEVDRAMRFIDSLPGGTRPSFLEDLEAGGPTELDALSGAVSRFAEQTNVQAPIHDAAAFLLRKRP
jgi:2-dehydropantoate 2-reductase